MNDKYRDKALMKDTSRHIEYERNYLVTDDHLGRISLLCDKRRR